jgi:hypothetical protein
MDRGGTSEEADPCRYGVHVVEERQHVCDYCGTQFCPDCGGPLVACPDKCRG